MTPKELEPAAASPALVRSKGAEIGLRTARPLIEDNSQKSKATTLAYLRVGYKITKDVKVALDVFNLFDRKASDIGYYYASRLPRPIPADRPVSKADSRIDGTAMQLRRFG